MKPAALALIVTGGVFLLAGIWASLVLPVQTTSKTYHPTAASSIVETYRRTLWGRPTYFKSHVTYPIPDEKPHGEGVGPIPDEWSWEGRLDWSCARYGQWIRRERNGTKWEEKIQWYIDDKEVSREEWERRK